MRACLADTNNYTTMGMTQYTVDAYERWEQQLDSISVRFRKILLEHIRHDFERSQQK